MITPAQKRGRDDRCDCKRTGRALRPHQMSRIPAVSGQATEQHEDGHTDDQGCRPQHGRRVEHSGLLRGGMAAASAMSSTTGGAAGPGGNTHSRSCSPSLTAIVSNVASRLNGVPAKGRSEYGLTDSAACSDERPSSSRPLASTLRTTGINSRIVTLVGSARSAAVSSPMTATRTRPVAIAGSICQ